MESTFFFLIKIRVVCVWEIKIGEISFFEWIPLRNPKETLLIFRFLKSGHGFEKQNIITCKSRTFHSNYVKVVI